MTSQWRLLLVSLCLVLMSGCAPAQRQSGQEAAQLSVEDAAAIRANLDRFVQSDLAGDWDSFFAQFTEDAVWMYSPDGPAVEGVAAMEQGNWARALEKELSPVQIDGRGDLAFARGPFSLLLDREGAVKRQGHFVTIHRKQSDGSWRIALFIANLT